MFFGLDVRLDDIIAHSNYDKEVADLGIWANDKNKVAPCCRKRAARIPAMSSCASLTPIHLKALSLT